MTSRLKTIIEIQDMDGKRLFDWEVSDKDWHAIQFYLRLTNKTLSEFIQEVIRDYTSNIRRDMGRKARWDRGDVHYVSDFNHPEFSHAHVEATIDGKSYHGDGYSKRHPDDKPNLHVGLLLAYSRAFEDLAKKLAREGNGFVKHYDDMRARNVELAEARAKESKKPKKKARLEPDLTNKSISK